ncbi:hypothetical protein AVEN_239514-1 [Araneus ventricosus]|uniref:Uncharacterized protein n=1 Tax=Araneus ventricosus TaxID=182803 RepID=A0A4Y2SH35_ARAVE|nr:hypothetical protein AVEN_239514-1 [Araneus ventricosus]
MSIYNSTYDESYWGRGGLLVRSQPHFRRAPCSKPDPIEDPPCMGPPARQIIRSGQMLPRRCGAEDWRWERQLRCRPRHLTAARNDEARPKTALVLLQKRDATKLNFLRDPNH